MKLVFIIIASILFIAGLSCIKKINDAKKKNIGGTNAEK